MLTVLGILTILSLVGLGTYLLITHRLNWPSCFSLAIVGILAGIVIGNFHSVSRFVVSLGEGQSVEFYLDQKVKQVATAAEEVQEIRDQIKILVRDNNNTNEHIQENADIVQSLVQEAKEVRTQVTRSEERVVEMSGNLRQTWVAFVQAFYLAMRTRHIHPVPDEAAAIIDQQLDTIVKLAYSNQEERTAFIQRLEQQARQATSN